MAGGVGARFWPMSKTARPKQFIDILGTGETLIQTTFNRFKNICPVENIYIVTSESTAIWLNNSCHKLLMNRFWANPCAAILHPCIAYANYKISQ
jgi:mannose-1-phosphate guanylyltransferase